jgi:phosphatidylserine/phosphatidylglycerophosphate/cardiolipin synthase-like enzyme
VYDALPGASGPKAKNAAAIAALKISSISTPRTTGKIMHNKFLVLSRNGKPVAVWTGSTNWTENGLYGHSNLGHVVEDAKVAAAYLAYYDEVRTSPAAADERDWMAQSNPAPPAPWDDDVEPVFSPRSGLQVLDWYAQLAGSAKRALLMTFAFGMHKSFQRVYEQQDGVLRFALMEKEGNGRGLAQGKKDIARIRRLPNVIVAIGNNIVLNSFDRWLKERRSLSATNNVRYIHTKYMLVDPLGKSPLVVTGSANFSEASTNANNENMLVVRRNPRIADIYLGEFMRLYSHYAFRETVARNRNQPTWNPAHLTADDTWQRDYFKPGHPRRLRREYFAGA